MKTKKKLKN